MMSVGLKPSLVMFEGVLAYELQSKQVQSDDQLEVSCTTLFVAWKSEGYKKFRVFVQLIEYDMGFYWYNFGREYYQRHVNQFSIYTHPIKDTWLIENGAVLMTRLELDFMQRDGVLNIIISEGIRDGSTKRGEWISSER
jgi:hypothetical protein